MRGLLRQDAGGRSLERTGRAVSYGAQIAPQAALKLCETCGQPRRHCQCVYDIRDPRAFVHATIRASRRFYSPDEREELEAEGMRILIELAHRFNPDVGRFSGFAAKYLRLKLEDAYHRLHPEHMLVARSEDDGGGRGWVYGERALSIEALVSDDPDRNDLLADRRERADLKTRLHQALMDDAIIEVKMATGVGELLAEGATPADVAQMLGLTSEQVKVAMERIRPAIARLRSEEQ